IPGQTFASLAEDIMLFREMDLEMIGIGPYLPHPATPLGAPAPADAKGNPLPPAGADQVPNTETMTCKVVALARLACPDANIPATTALATVNSDRGYELGLSRGANVVMPNITPSRYRVLYEIYPAKSCIREDFEAFHSNLVRRILAMGRTVGSGRGDNVRFTRSGSKTGAPAPEKER
ncbi:MAG: [FeFe] hydrogenase H-cluster radical SAM maturase HydE, partial [Planctomycetota bacterium]|nr:[FeFe] hydrogenase H-cluster radical SAM maturase HydE [Planctomycetota bacterium]